MKTNHHSGRALSTALLLYSTVCLFCGLAKAQEMTPGFSMLEIGNFKEARGFFEHILADHPENKTAKLCYGRAVGLSGDPDIAIGIFLDLLDAYPGDVEVLANLAESYLWKNDPESAIPVYLGMLENDPQSFGVLLGLANSHSMKQDYPSAYAYVNKAIAVDPANPQARTSAKYIRMGFANKLAAEYHLYDSAIALIDENLSYNSIDQESLMLLANVHIISKNFEKAYSVYQSLSDSVQSLKGESTTLHLIGADASALRTARDLRKLQIEEEKVQFDIEMHYISALLWNNELKLANAIYDSLDSISDSKELISKKAEIAMYEADFKVGASNYLSYLSHFPDSFNGNLGRANALYALGVDAEAYSIAFRSKVLFPGQLDVLGFIEKLNQKHSPYLTGEYMYGKASDGSIIIGQRAVGRASLSPALAIDAEYATKTYTPPLEGADTQSETLRLGIHRQLNQRFKVNGALARVELRIPDSLNSLSSNYRWDLDVDTDIWVSKNQKTTIGYATEVQDFNAALANQNLVAQHVYLRNNMFWKRSYLGWYTEAYYTKMSDQNVRKLLFTSGYKSIPTQVPLKFGLNLLQLNFNESKPTLYFSPFSLTKLEGFGGVSHSKADAFSFLWEIAGGIQYVDGVSQGNWRTQGSFSKYIGRVQLYAKGLYTTISEVAGAGFSYFELKAGLVYQLSKKPAFYGRIQRKKATEPSTYIPSNE